jgi:hypothetical protein
MRLTVATHGHCFDGMASAALFTVLARKVYGEVGVRYRACTYGPGIDGVPPNWLDGEQNAVLDYRYGPRERLGWYFDHHITAFATPEIERTALAEADETLATPFVADAKKRLYFDPTYGSCTKLVADVAKARFGLVLPPHLEELVRVADIIDAARYESAADAIRIDTPAAVLAAVVEPRGNTTFLHAVIPSLIDEGLEAAVALPRVQARCGSRWPRGAGCSRSACASGRCCTGPWCWSTWATCSPRWRRSFTRTRSTRRRCTR